MNRIKTNLTSHTSSRPAQKTTTVGIFLIDGFALMSYSSVIEPMRAANILSDKGQIFAIEHISLDKESAKSSSGAIIPATAFREIDPNEKRFDYLFVLAGGDPFRFEGEDALAWLRRMSRQDVVLVGVSGGPAILVLAGLMGKSRMTIHWEHAPELIENWPEIDFEQALYVEDGNRVSCAGGTAPIDYLYKVIERSRDEALSKKVSDWFMHTELRPSTSAQRAGLVARYNTHNAMVIRAIEVMQNHISEPLSQQEIAAHARVSTRHLIRVFRSELHQSPMAFYRDLRFESAQKLLEQTALSITEIAYATGFASSNHFSSLFRKKFGRSPKEYRKG